MKILQVIPRFNPQLGGGVDVVYNLSKSMAEKGHEVSIITSDYKFDQDYADELRNQGIKVIPFKHLANICLFIPTPSMNKWVSNNVSRFDIIHLNGARSYQNNVIYKYSRRYNVPYILQAHGSILRLVQRQELKRLYDTVWGYKLFRNSSKLIALCNSEADAYKSIELDEKKIEILPNGVDLCKFEKLPQKGEFKKKYGIDQNEMIILYLGRLHKSKNIELLLNAYSDLTTKIHDIRLVLVGPNEMGRYVYKEIDKLDIKDKVLITGYLTEQDKFKSFIDADVFVTPRFYGFPITFAESCACGLPIITTNSGDILDWIDNRIGYVVNPNKNKLSMAIQSLLIDKETRIKFGQEAQLLARDRFNWPKIADQLEIIYKDAIFSKI